MISSCCKNWLASNETTFLKSISENFYATGSSAMDSSKSLLSGTPYGGLAIFWRKRIRKCVKIECYEDPGLMGILIDNNIMVLNVYLPYDDGRNREECVYYLYKINSIIMESCTPCVIAMGDFNVHISEHCSTGLV